MLNRFTHQLIGLILCSVFSPLYAANSLNEDWYKAGFETRFPPGMPFLPDAGGWAVLYRSADDFLGEERQDIFQPVSEALNQAVSAETTTNPFRSLYPQLYTAENIAKRLAECPLLGVALDVDQNLHTQEWLLSFSALRCLQFDTTERLLSGDDHGHKWLLQQQADSSYRILAEGDGIFYLTRQEAANYQAIRTRMFIARAFPEDTLQCGGAELSWHYQAEHYQLTKVEYLAQDCQLRYFPDATGLAWEREYARYEQQVKTLVDQWLERWQQP